MNNLLNIFLMSLGLALPLLIASSRSKTEGAYFKIANLSKVSAILIVFYGVSFYYYKAHDITIGHFYFYVFIKIILALAFISAISIFAPLKTDISRLIGFPRFEQRSALYFIVIIFFLYTSFGSLLAVERHPDEVKQQLVNVFTLLAIDDKPYSSAFMLVVMEIISIFGEEIVYRYYAINALKQKLNEHLTIILSSLIWSLLHWNSHPSLFIVGIFIGYIYWKTESLSICCVLHLTFNFAVSTEIFYVFYKEIGSLPFSSFHYAIALFLFQVMLFFFAKGVTPIKLKAIA